LTQTADRQESLLTQIFSILELKRFVVKLHFKILNTSKGVFSLTNFYLNSFFEKLGSAQLREVKFWKVGK